MSAARTSRYERFVRSARGCLFALPKGVISLLRVACVGKVICVRGLQEMQ